jgi:hypothetical protein
MSDNRTFECHEQAAKWQLRERRRDGEMVMEQAPATKKRPLAVDPAILQRSSEIGDAIWLALWAYDRATRQCLCGDGTLVGLVLGGAVIPDERIATELGHSVKWVRRWRARAVKAGLLRAKRFPYGNLLAVVLPGKKFVRHEVKEAPEWAQSPTLPNAKKRGRAESRVPTLGLSGVPKGAIQSAQNGVSERSKLGTRRKTITMTTAHGLAQVTFPPSLYSPHRGEACARQKNAEHPPSPEANSSEHAKPTKQLYELQVDRRFLTAFGQVVAHFARELENDVRSVTQASVERARELKLQIPPDPEHFVRRIIGKSNAGE